MHFLAKFQVERAQRFVEQQQFRFVHQRARDGDALLLPARKRVNGAVLIARKPHELELFAHLLLDFLLRELFDFEPERHIVEHIVMREQGITLEHRVQAALIGWRVDDGLALEQDVARGWRLKPAEQAQERRLAAAGRPQQGQKFIFADV